MQNIIETFSNYIIRLNRNLKRFIAIITDFSLCIICTWIAFYLRLEQGTNGYHTPSRSRYMYYNGKRFKYDPKDVGGEHE